jgi:PEP-CTERM motif
LDVTLINGFTPNGGQQFTILTASSIVNNGLVLGGSAAGSFDLLVNSTSVILQAIGLAGDYNHNGIVDVADYVVWRKGLGTTYTQDDYSIWRAHFGQTAGSGSGATAAVPEPTTLVLLMFAAAGCCLRRRRTS